MSYSVRRVKVESSEQLDALALACGSLYSQTVTWFWRTVKRQGIWLKPSSMMRWLNSDQMHAHTADATVQAFYASLDSWRARRKTDPNAKPPRRGRKFFRIEYKGTAIRHRNGQLLLSNGRHLAPTVLAWPWDTPRTVVIRWRETGGYEAIATYRVAKTKPIETGRVAGVDLGEIHMAVVHDGEQCTIFNGRVLRSKRQYQNKLKAKLSTRIDGKPKGSKRRKRMIRSKQKQLAKLKNQIRDIEHKMSSKLVSTLQNRNVQTVVIGDVRDIRQDLDYGKKANQKLHQWAHGKMRFYTTYKSERAGMEVKLQEERYTSQECPQCSHRYKPGGRVYHCRKCGFRYHRDGVGSWNIRKKYLKPVVSIVGRMARPIGVRFTPHLCVAQEATRVAA
jgi:putative transposase